MSTKGATKNTKYYIHVAVGLAILLLFWNMPPIDPITPIGMKCLGAFLSMVYLWSLVDTLWPSILGLLAIAVSGYSGEGFAGLKVALMNAFGQDTVLLILFGMVLFGAMEEAGCTKYLVRWFLSRKIFKNRPYVFLMMVYSACYVLAALMSPVMSLIILWPLLLSVMDSLEITREDKIWKYFFVGMFVCSTLAQPLLPFFGAQLIVISAFQNMVAVAGNPMLVPGLQYMVLNILMTAIIMAVYLAVMKFVLRVDVSKLKSIDPEMMKSRIQLPRTTKRQKIYLLMIPGYLASVLLPGFLPASLPGVTLLNTLGPVGITLAWVLVFAIVRVEGEVLLNFQKTAATQVNWGIFFMIASAVYCSNSLSSPTTGISEFLVKLLNPILGGQSEMVFVAIMLTVALIMTNLANNAAMAVVLMPVVVSFCAQMNLNPMPLAMMLTMMVFVAMLTPSASPHAGMMHARKDIYSTKDIMTIGFPVCIFTLLVYIFIGYPMAKMLFI